MRFATLSLMAVAAFAGQADGLKRYRAMPTATDLKAVLVVVAIAVAAFVAAALLMNWIADHWNNK